MTTLRRCLDMLERYQIPYVHTRHPNAYRAREVAVAEHMPPYMLAKTVIVRGPNGYAMAVLPADCKIDFEQLAATLNFEHLRLATEEEVRELFPDTEVGAMPPFGPLFGMCVYLDARLAKVPYILFNAGTHRDAIHIAVSDYVRLTDPVIVQFSRADETPLLAEAMTWT
jgi:Ala-tRNA(Pro) deacylase